MLIQGPAADARYEMHEVVNEACVGGPHYSAVAIDTRGGADGWPALGGTRCIFVDSHDVHDLRAEAQREAGELASSMHVKNEAVRRAEELLAKEGNPRFQRARFSWGGGKGVIALPRGVPLTPERLMTHGKLIEQLGGRYIGSKDVGVGTTELRWIGRTTSYVIGLECHVDTGEATAAGVVAGMVQAVTEGRGSPAAGGQALAGSNVLVIGCGKVGWPLVVMLEAAGATVFVFDPAVRSEADVEKHYRSMKNLGAAIDDRHHAALARAAAARRIFADEMRALTDPHMDILSPNGGRTAWLSTPPDGQVDTRAQIVANAKRGSSGRLRLILGAGNDQLPVTGHRAAERDSALLQLAGADITFVPDPVVSPGGVIAVSHELADEWRRADVIEDATAVVARSTRALFERARALKAHVDAPALWTAFEELVAGRAVRDRPPTSVRQRDCAVEDRC